MRESTPTSPIVSSAETMREQDEFLREAFLTNQQNALGVVNAEIARLQRMVLGQYPDPQTKTEAGRNEALFFLQEYSLRKSEFFFRKHGLSELADRLPASVNSDSSKAERPEIKTWFERGYRRMLVVPPSASDFHALLRDWLIPSADLSPNVSASFPNGIVTVDANRRDRSYLLLTNPDVILHPGSRGKTAIQLNKKFSEEGLCGLTLVDFLLEEQLHLDETGKHLIDRIEAEGTSWLLGSTDKDGRYLYGVWNTSKAQIRLGADAPTDRFPALGARSAVVIPL